jgi:uncharacterized membrane protein/thiol-disulfide isomerase/thioredoxin
MLTRLLKMAFVFSLISSSFLFTTDSNARDLADQIPIVRAVFFYSTSCGHCHKVMTEDFPPLLEKYGDQLQIIGINISSPEGQELYQTYIEVWKIPRERQGVPALVVADVDLVGSGEIPQFFPGIIEEGLSSGGIDWPEIPGLREIIDQVERESEDPTNGETLPTNTVEESQVDTTETPDPNTISTEDEKTPTNTVEESQVKSTEPSEPTQANQTGEILSTDNLDADASLNITIPFDDEITVADRFRLDLEGNILAVVVLVGMIISLIWILMIVIRTSTTKGTDWSWVIPVLSIIGLFVAGYLSFVEVTETEAVCGPVGDCNSVQQSPYAMLFGFLPVGVLGLMGYIAILFGLIIKRYGPESWHDTLTILIWAMALFGVIFSIYLTFLEPFVIGATCLWCISSAIIITLQLWAATEPVRQIWMESEDDLEA